MDCLRNLAKSHLENGGKKEVADLIYAYAESPTPAAHLELVKVGFTVVQTSETVLLLELEKFPGLEPVVTSKLLNSMTLTTDDAND